MKKTIAILLALSLLLALPGCAAESSDLMEDVPERIVCLAEVPQIGDNAADFGIRLFRSSLSNEGNTLISPLSVLTALSMTAGGAKGETLTQMEAVLGASSAELDSYLYAYMDGLGEELRPANGIWFTDDSKFHVVEDFLERNAGYYHADLYQAPMNNDTLNDINNWVNEKTGGMIPKILDDIAPDAVMYLVNALAFDARWQEVYYEHQVTDSVFTKEDATAQDMELMHSTEHHYLEDENATGFIKYYEGGEFAFVALLPKEGMTVEEYVETLTGEALREMLANPTETTVYAAIPKFETEYNTEMSEILKSMGMTDAFDVSAADFSALGTYEGGNPYISRIVHKTFISVSEQGTQAGAATMVEMVCGAAMLEEEPKTVTLDRPFVYMLIDCEENLPVFIGAMMDMEG